MNLSWLQSALFGLISGITDILPVSASAHRELMLKFFGAKTAGSVLMLLLHLSVFAALYISSQAQFVKMNRARALAKVPKNKRKRPLDVRSMMDMSLIKTMMIPLILGLLLYQNVKDMKTSLPLMALFLFLNGVILYVPQFFPTGNKDSRTLSRVEGGIMGLGSALSILPGMSTVGIMTSIGSVCGVDRLYALNMTFIIKMMMMLGLIFHDILGIISGGAEALSFAIIVRYLFTAVLSFGASVAGIRMMRRITAERGYALFGVYCWGLALFIFILNLVV